MTRKVVAEAVVGILLVLPLTGCGTTKTSNTTRTATEQLLLTNSVDRTMNQLDLTALAGRKVFFDKEYIANSTDEKYLLSSLRQRIMSSGAILQESKADAEYILEVRIGAFGTDQNDLLVGISETSTPTALTGGVTIPEVSIIKRVDQKAVLKMHLFVIHRESGKIVWQSGELLQRSAAKSMWVLGAGPIQSGDIYSETNFNGEELKMPMLQDSDGQTRQEIPSVEEEAFYVEEATETNPLVQAAQEEVDPIVPESEPPK